MGHLTSSQDKMNKALAFVLLGALCATGLPLNKQDAVEQLEYSLAVGEMAEEMDKVQPPVEERKKKGKKSKEEFIPEPDTITGAPPVEERKKKAKKSKEEFIPEPDTITGAPPVEERKKKAKKAKKSKEEFIPEPDTITGA